MSARTILPATVSGLVAPVNDEEVVPVALANSEWGAPIAPVNDEWIEPIAPANNEWVAPIVPVNNEWIEPVAPANNVWVAPIVPASDEWVEPIVPVNDEWIAPVASANDESVDPIAPVNDESVEPVASANDEWVEPVASANDKWVEPFASANDERVEPIASAIDEWVAPIAVASDEWVEPRTGTEAELSPEPYDLIALAGPRHLDEGYRDHTSRTYAAALLPSRGNEHLRSAALMPIELDEADPLARLADEYRKALLHQTTGDTHELKTMAIDGNPGIAPQQDPFVNPGQGSLLDFLVSDKNIDTVLENMDAFGADRIYEDEESHEILSLLASEHAVFQHAPRSAHLAREEHHMISVDSHIHMLDSTEHQEPGYHHESHH